MSIAENRRAHFDYHLEERHEAGMVLEGWEIKAIRAGQVQLTDGYVLIRDGELFLIGCRINALRSASTHVTAEADRTKKLLMHKAEIRRLVGKFSGTIVKPRCSTLPIRRRISSLCINSFLVRSGSGSTCVEAERSGLMRQPIRCSSPSRIST